MLSEDPHKQVLGEIAIAERENTDKLIAGLADVLHLPSPQGSTLQDRVAHFISELSRQHTKDLRQAVGQLQDVSKELQRLLK